MFPATNARIHFLAWLEIMMSVELTKPENIFSRRFLAELSNFIFTKKIFFSCCWIFKRNSQTWSQQLQSIRRRFLGSSPQINNCSTDFLRRENRGFLATPGAVNELAEAAWERNVRSSNARNDLGQLGSWKSSNNRSCSFTSHSKDTWQLFFLKQKCLRQIHR